MNISINSVFTPLTYEDYMAPVKDYMAEYKEIEGKYESLQDMAGEFADVANQQLNPISYRLYSDFANQLAVGVDNFSQGLNTMNRGDYLRLKREYNDKIMPIKKANERWKEQKQINDTAKASDPTVFFAKNDLKVDDYLYGATPNTDYYSGATLEQETANMSDRIATSMFDQLKKTSAAKGEYFDFQIIKGAPLEYIDAVFFNTVDSLSMDELKEKYGNKAEEIKQGLKHFEKAVQDQRARFKGYDKQGQQASDSAIYRGVLAGLQRTEHNLQQDPTNQRAWQSKENAADRRSHEKVAQINADATKTAAKINANATITSTKMRLDAEAQQATKQQQYKFPEVAPTAIRTWNKNNKQEFSNIQIASNDFFDSEHSKGITGQYVNARKLWNELTPAEQNKFANRHNIPQECRTAYYMDQLYDFGYEYTNNKGEPTTRNNSTSWNFVYRSKK